jgi:hypothetical protein
MLDGEFWQIRVQNMRPPITQMPSLNAQEDESLFGGFKVLDWLLSKSALSPPRLERLCHKVVERSHMITRHARRAVFDHSRLPPDA